MNTAYTIEQITRDAQIRIEKIRNAERELAATIAANALSEQQMEERRQAEERRRAELEEFQNGPLDDAKMEFANLHERAGQLKYLVEESERLHLLIIDGAQSLAKDAQNATEALICASAAIGIDPDEALDEAGADGLRFYFPEWLREINKGRWAVTPAVYGGTLYQYARGRHAELIRKPKPKVR